MRQHRIIIPERKWEHIVISENGDPLVPLRETGRLKIRYAHVRVLTRKTISEMLTRAAERLPDGLFLTVEEGYRSLEEQQRIWDEKIASVKKAYPSWDIEKVSAYVARFVAPPSPLSNHHCGGAVDAVLTNEKGEVLDMGPELNSKTRPADYKTFPMFPNTFFKRRITRQQARNRTTLRKAMESAGFVWYPNEWWHYCWGDRMWAAYAKRKECFYGPVELPPLTN